LSICRTVKRPEVTERTVTEAAGSRQFDTLPDDNSIPRKLDEFLLLRETHHRLANTFTVLVSILRCDLAPFASRDLGKAFARLEEQILAFGKLHRSLLVGARSDWISVQYYVEHLCKALSDALLQPLNLACEVHVDAGELPSERCEVLGLVIAELVTNAAKYAFCNRVDGLVRVELVQKVDAWLCTVSDNGEGTRTAMPGVGSKIVEQLVRTMGGRVATRSGLSGTSTAIIFPIAELGAARLSAAPKEGDRGRHLL
jgi:two-component sensor histidine kinase